MKSAFFYETAFGRIGIAEDGGAITNVFFGSTVQPKEYAREETPLLREAACQMNEYFGGKRAVFELPLRPEGTPFERKVWDALLAIPYGSTKSYGQVASEIGCPKASRAVGRANGRNPVSIFIPCHRVIGAGGSLTGYAGGLDMKRALLDLEKNNGTAFSG